LGARTFGAPPHSVGAAIAWVTTLGSWRTVAVAVAFLIGSGLFFALGRHADVGQLVSPTEMRFVDAKVTAVEPTHFSEGRSKRHRRSGRVIYAHTVVATTGETAVGYSTSRRAVGSAERIEVLDDGARTRVAGLRARPFDGAVALALGPLALAALLAFCVTVVRASAHVGRLRRGVVVGARVVDVEPITRRTKHGGRRTVAYDVTLSFPVPGAGEVTTQTRLSSMEGVGDDARELVVYDPEHPRKVSILDALPGAPELVAGEWRHRESGGAVTAALVTTALASVALYWTAQSIVELARQL
jgi:hypothetical protein